MRKEYKNIPKIGQKDAGITLSSHKQTMQTLNTPELHTHMNVQ